MSKAREMLRTAADWIWAHTNWEIPGWTITIAVLGFGVFVFPKWYRRRFPFRPLVRGNPYRADDVIRAGPLSDLISGFSLRLTPRTDARVESFRLYFAQRQRTWRRPTGRWALERGPQELRSFRLDQRNAWPVESVSEHPDGGMMLRLQAPVVLAAGEPVWLSAHSGNTAPWRGYLVLEVKLADGPRRSVGHHVTGLTPIPRAQPKVAASQAEVEELWGPPVKVESSSSPGKPERTIYNYAKGVRVTFLGGKATEVDLGAEGKRSEVDRASRRR